MYCKHCGSSIDDKSVFCRFCGKPLDTANMNKVVYDEAPKPAPQQPVYTPPVQNTYAPPQQGYYAPPAPQPKKTENSIAIVGFVLSFLIPIAGLICSIIGVQQHEKGRRQQGARDSRNSHKLCVYCNNRSVCARLSVVLRIPNVDDFGRNVATLEFH